MASSLDWARLNQEQCLVTMRAHAQELSDDVLWSHVRLYVNDQTHELGAGGRDALSALFELARERGLIGSGSQLTVIEGTRA